MHINHFILNLLNVNFSFSLQCSTALETEKPKLFYVILTIILIIVSYLYSSYISFVFYVKQENITDSIYWFRTHKKIQKIVQVLFFNQKYNQMHF